MPKKSCGYVLLGHHFNDVQLAKFVTEHEEFVEIMMTLDKYNVSDADIEKIVKEIESLVDDTASDTF
jgi:chaperonin cofactor prefoldin